jgi:hypothetical protein
MTSKEWDVVEDKLIAILMRLVVHSVMYYFHIKKRLSYFWRGMMVILYTLLILPILMITIIPPYSYDGRIGIWYVNLWRRVNYFQEG